MRWVKRSNYAFTLSFLAFFPLLVFIPSNAVAVPATITQEITSLECTVTSTTNGIAEPTLSLDTLCSPLQESEGSTTKPPTATIIEDNGRKTVQLPYLQTSVYPIATNTDGVSTITVPFEPLTSSESTLIQKEATQSVASAVVVMFFSAAILAIVVVLL
ncbi:MAG: hypothetical protein WAR37_02145 [Candidatus Microsaccharimonas sp.]